jgi:hypothetical protein
MINLLNHGLIVFNPGDCDTVGKQKRESTVIVTGAARGGTSVLAQVLERLGLFLGDTCDPVVVEDTAILHALRSSDMDRLEHIIAERNQRFSQWGFKIPNLYDFLPPAEALRFRNPRFIIVFRDPLAIARRNELSMFRGPTEALREAGLNVARLTSYAGELTEPALLVSYEKALQHPEHVIDTIAAFCGLVPSEKQRAIALSAVTPSGFTYIIATRRVCWGQIDNIAGIILRGWCCYRDSDDVVEIELLVDGAPVGVYRSGDYREDLLGAAIGLGHHAFNVDLSGFGIAPSSIISVRPAGVTLPLPNSGKTVEELRQNGD